MEKGDGEISSAVEAGETLGEGDEDPCDDVEACLAKASLPMDVNSTSVETPSLDCGMEKTETFDGADEAAVEPIEPLAKCMEEEFEKTLKECDEKADDEDYFGSDSNDEGSEPERGLAAVSDEGSQLDLSPRDSHQSRLKYMQSKMEEFFIQSKRNSNMEELKYVQFKMKTDNLLARCKEKERNAIDATELPVCEDSVDW